jgi:uncharacterized protein
MNCLTIIGASARAAAMSARHAGFEPWCADLFADADLRSTATHVVRCPVDRYPAGFRAILCDAPDCPWMFTGGLENYPDLIRQMAEIRPLWGNGPEALRASRSPETVTRILREAGLSCPEIRTTDTDLPAKHRWLRKPLAGSAGQGIAFANSTIAKRTGTHYFQQFVDGTPMSAVFVRARGRVQLIGVAEQLIGTTWLNAEPFHYAGNIGPIDLSDHVRSELLRIGHVLGEQCDLLGLFGVDFVLNDDGPWVVEVNPRYPASVEVYERATGISALALHRTAFDSVQVEMPVTKPSGQVVGKGVLYARQRLVFSESPALHVEADRALVTFADIPMPGEVIQAGWPVFTVLVHAETLEGCRRALFDAASTIDRQLLGTRKNAT